MPGDIRFVDRNNDGVIDWGDNTVDNPGDKKIIGNSSPRYKFGIDLDASWNGFDIRMFFQGVAKRDYWLGDNMFWGASGGLCRVLASRTIWISSVLKVTTGDRT